MAIENIAADPSPLLTSIGSSGLIGFLIGYAIKKVMKILAVGAGIFFAALMYLESQNIVSINWDKLQIASQNAVSTLTKEMMLRALESSDRAHTLLTGPPASAKSLFVLQIEKYMSSKVYLAEGASTTKAGLQRFITENQHKEIIIIDEIDKMPMQHQEGLLTMMERGEFANTKIRNTKTVKANVVIFATSNSTERLSKPLLSRFTVFEILEYTYEEFEAISVRLIKKPHPDAVIQITSSVWNTGSEDIRDVLKIAKLCNPLDTEEDISRLISIHQKYRKTGKECNN